MKLWTTAVVVILAAVAGAEESAFLVTGDILPVPVVANGYVQAVTSDRKGVAMVRVSTSLNPIGADGVYSARRGLASPAVPPGFILPAGLEAGLRNEIDGWTAATRVLEWVAEQVDLDTEDRGQQDAASVLRRRVGRCSGMANATAALLMAAGFEARTVSGLLVSDEGNIPHRWVECRLPDVGWVPTDPTLGLWVVTPRHMVFADAVVRPPAVQVLEMDDSGLARLPRRNGRPLRPNRGTDLVCRLGRRADRGRGDRSLARRRGRGAPRPVRPRGEVFRPPAGNWRLVVVADGEVLEHTEIELRPGQVHSLAVVVPVRN